MMSCWSCLYSDKSLAVPHAKQKKLKRKHKTYKKKRLEKENKIRRKNLKSDPKMGQKTVDLGRLS